MKRYTPGIGIRACSFFFTASAEYELFFETETTCTECKSVFIIEEPEEDIPFFLSEL